jgi:hypothetical protein
LTAALPTGRWVPAGVFRWRHARTGVVARSTAIEAQRLARAVVIARAGDVLTLIKPKETAMTPKQRAALADARDKGLYRDRHGFRAGFSTSAAIHPAAVIRPLIQRGLIRRAGNGCFSITPAGRAALAPPAPPAAPAPIRQYVD